MTAIRTKIGESYYYLHEELAGEPVFLPDLKGVRDFGTEAAAMAEVENLRQNSLFAGYSFDIIHFS